MKVRFWLTLVPSLLLALIFLSSGIGKLLGHSALLLSMSTLTFFPDWLEFLIVNVLPWGELLMGILLLAGILTQLVSFVSCILVACFIFQNSWMIMHGFSNEPCSCFGILDRVFLGKLSTLNALYIDVFMLVMAILIYLAYQGKLVNWRPWYLRRKVQPVVRPEEPGVSSGEGQPPSQADGQS
jgi:uncharacterized membrane protein YphA (DoxX/SURF4 family)